MFQLLKKEELIREAKVKLYICEMIYKVNFSDDPSALWCIGQSYPCRLIIILKLLSGRT